MRDDFTEEVKRTLAARVAYLCSNPDCRAPTSGPQIDATKALNVGVAAHITSAAEGGPRYNSLLSPEERRHPDNGIWLCQNCGKLIDNDPSRYTEKLIRAWKEIAEDHALGLIGKTVTRESNTVPESESQRKLRAILPWRVAHPCGVGLCKGGSWVEFCGHWNGWRGELEKRHSRRKDLPPLRG
jgi:hypothetical protein